MLLRGHIQQQLQCKTLIYESELDRIAGWVEEYPNLETGGDLFGFWTHTGAPVVQFVLGPGPRSQHNPTSFYQEKDFLINAGNLLRRRHGLQHIGEWHSHHQIDLAQPSSGDARTILRALEQYNFPQFLLCIANLRMRRDTESMSQFEGEYEHCNTQTARTSGHHLETAQQRRWTVSIGNFLFTHSEFHYQPGLWVILPGESPIRTSLRQDCDLIFSPEPRLSRSWEVDTITLDSPAMEPPQQAKISQGLWYSTSQGLLLLRSLDTEMKRSFPGCRLLRTTSEKLYFTFDHDHEVWRVELPENFPYSAPVFRVNNGEPMEDIDWSEGSELVSSVRKHIELHHHRKN